ncbi:MAG: aldo/keto reductase [Turicibacter sp.]|nr:aldo/keto reductase [Turicibacter sp.]
MANRLGISLSVLALAWDLRHQQISSVITGASRPGQLEANVLASGYVLSDDVLDEIENILDYKPFVRRIG